MWNWDEKTRYDLAMRMLRQLGYPETVRQIKWLSCVASTDDDETEIRMVVKVCSDHTVAVLRVYSNTYEQVYEQIQFQKLLHQGGIGVPAVQTVVNSVISEQLTVTAYLEEWIEGNALTENEFVRYSEFLGKLHEHSRRLNCPFSVERNHLLYDTRRIEAEIRGKLHTDPVWVEQLVQNITALMLKTEKEMSKLQRFPVHGDYSASNLIKKGEDLFLVDFGLSGLGYFPEETGEAAAQIICSCSHFDRWEERLEDFISVYSKENAMSELESELTEAVAVIALVIRVLHAGLDEKTIMSLCDEFINRKQRIE